MVTRMGQALGAIVAVALGVTALWGWGQAAQIAEDAHRPELVIWAVRCAALSAAAGAQVLILSFIVGALYRTRWSDELMRLVAGLVCTVALLGAIGLALAGK